MKTIAIRKDEFLDLLSFQEDTSLIPGEILEIFEVMEAHDYQSAFIISRSSKERPMKVLIYDFIKMIYKESIEGLLINKDKEEVDLPTHWVVLDENTIRPM